MSLDTPAMQQAFFNQMIRPLLRKNPPSSMLSSFWKMGEQAFLVGFDRDAKNNALLYVDICEAILKKDEGMLIEIVSAMHDAYYDTHTRTSEAYSGAANGDDSSNSCS